MKTTSALLLMILLVPLAAQAQVYKWVDKNGQINFGDSPPEGTNAEALSLPRGPSEQQVQAAQQNLQEALDARAEASTEPTPAPEAETTADSGLRPDLQESDLGCYKPLSGILNGPYRHAYDPIEPTAIDSRQRNAVRQILARAKGRWQGTLTELTCSGSSDNPQSKTQYYDLRSNASWDQRLSQLRLESQGANRQSRVQEQQSQIFEVGDALFFLDSLGTGMRSAGNSIATGGNAAEGLYLDDTSLAFMIKRRIRTIVRTELRYLQVTARRLEFTELYSHNNIVTGSRTWILNR